MSSYRVLWISAAMSAVMTVPAFASESDKPAPAPPVYTRTYVFPATGFAFGSETVRISVVNIAPAAHNGTKASCNGSITFHDSNNGPLGKAPIAITTLGTGQIQIGEYPDTPQPPIPGRSELQGSVQVTIDPAAPAPCSLLMTLEVYETKTGVTRAIVTTAAEEPVAAIPQGRGR